jgi:hypothetical protein
MSHSTASVSPTNAEIVRLLHELSAQLERVEQNQDRLARLLDQARREKR